MPSPDERAEALAKKVNSLFEQKFRTAVIAEALAEMPEDDVAEVLRIIIDKGGLKDAKYSNAFKSLREFPDIFKRIGSRKMAGVYSLCRSKGYDDIIAMMKEIPPVRSADDAPGDIYVDPKLKDVSLGMKKSLGRLGDRDLVNRLLHDQDPTVIEQILNNPGLTEEQVVKIAAKRPTSAAVLRGISLNTKWISRYIIKKSIVLNPYTPTEISIRLVGVLLKQDVQEVVRNAQLHPDLRSTARKILLSIKTRGAEVVEIQEENDEDGDDSNSV